MSVRRTTAVILTAAALSVAGVVLPTVGSAAPAPGAAVPAGDVAATSAKTVVIGCFGKGVVKPKQISLACATGQLMFYKLKWTTWGLNSATGTGMLAWNTCEPTDCASGITLKYKVKVKLDRIATGPTSSGQFITAFTRLTATFVPKGDGPAGADTSTFTLDNRPA